MRLLALSFILTLLDKTQASKGSSLDLALETVLEFNDAINPDVLDKIKNIVDDIRKTFVEKPKENISAKNRKPYEFVDFLKDLIITSNYFKDEDLVDLLGIIHSEINQLDLKDVSYLRGYFRNNVANMKRDSRKARKNLDNLLNNLRNKNGNRKDHFYLNFINSLYKRNSEQKFVNILNRLNVFRRRSDTGDELRKFIKKALQDLVSQLNMTDEKSRILQRWFEEHKQSLMNDRALSDVENYDDAPRLPTYKLKLKNITLHKANATNPKYLNDKSNTRKDRVKLTHVTLYPDNIDIIDKRKFITDMKFQSEFRDDVETDRIETETREQISSSDDDSSKSEDESDTKDLSNEVTDDVDVNTKNTRTTRRTRKSTISYKTKKIEKVQNEHEILKSNYDSDEETSSTASASIEQFGNLHKHKKKTIEKHNTAYKTKNVSTTPKPTTYKTLETDKNRRKYPDTSKIEIEKTTTKEPITKLQLNKLLSSSLKNIPKTHNIRRTIFLTSNTVTTKPNHENILNNTNATSLNSTKKYLLTTQTTKTSKAIENTTKAAETTTTQLTSEVATQTTFNVNNYIKNSGIQEIENAEKKSVIEQKMKEDLENLFSTTTTTTTTEAYADIFKDMEDEFELS